MDQTPAWLPDLHIRIVNDDHSPFQGVVELFKRCFGCNSDTATTWARQVHRQGEARFGPWSEPVATAIHGEMLRLAPQLGCRRLTVELEDVPAASTTGAAPRIARQAFQVLGEHFGDWAADDLLIVKREFPSYLRVDLLRAIARITENARKVGIHAQNRYAASDLATLLSERDRGKLVGALQYEDMDIGESRPVRLALNCLSLLDSEQPAPAPSNALALWVNLRAEHGEAPNVVVEVLSPPGEAAARRTAMILEMIEEAVASGRSYRGKILSLEASETYRGLSAQAMTVHPRAPVQEHELILPQTVRAALERHVIEFAAHRRALAALGQSARKGVLLYGPPGTGKTHTIRYLAHRLQDHTTFLVTAEQVGLIAVYFRLARMFAPSILVIEDADLIARQREDIQSACEETMLNRLLNEMDGLRSDSEIFVIMTTNRPQKLEAALVQRPGRIDHAIQVPVPDEDGRRLLLRLYGGRLRYCADAERQLVERSDGVSAAFVREMARRLAQHSLRTGKDGEVSVEDARDVLEEMLGDHDALNLRLMGGVCTD